MKEEQKQHLIDMMQKDEELGLYEYIGECKGNDGNGCFMDSSGHDCGCYTRSIKQETEHLLSTKANKERLLDDIFNDEKRQGIKELIDAQKQAERMYSEGDMLTAMGFASSIDNNMEVDDKLKLCIDFIQQFKNK